MISTENKLKVANYLEQGRKIDAVKYVRDTQKVHLSEAAKIVESIEIEFFPGRKQFSLGSMNMSDPGLIVGSVFSGLGGLFLILTCIFFWLDHKKTEDSSVIEGTVTSLDYGTDGMAAPVIRYRLDGEKKVIRGTVWSSPPSYEIGEQVELLVDNANHSKVTINALFERYFLIGIFTLFTVIFGGIGILVLYFLKN